MNNIIKIMEGTAKFFSVDKKYKTIIDEDVIKIEYNSKDIDLAGEVDTKRAIILKDNHIYFYCYSDNTLRNDMSAEEFIKIHSDKIDNAITINDVNLYGCGFILGNDNEYYLEYKDIYYYLDTIKNKLIKSCNCLDEDIEDIDVSNEVKLYIINRCLEDMSL